MFLIELIFGVDVEHCLSFVKEKHIFIFFEGTRKQKEKGGRIVKERIQISHSSQGRRSRAQ